MDLRPRSFLAPNASAMTLGGTITYVVGRRRIAIIDPGSRDARHLDALAAAAADADRIAVLVTHDHPDHTAGAPELAQRTGAALHGPGTLADGVSIETDDGDLVVIRTPGHTPDHIALHWPAAEAVFCGDLMMGDLDTTVVAAPEGDLAQYLKSLERVRELRPRTIYPAHGPAFTDPDAAIDRYIHHREDRLAQVAAALEQGDDDAGSITDRIYGPALDPGLRVFAEAAVAAYLAYLHASGRV